MSTSASEMVSEETETVENDQLIYAKWSLLSIKFNIVIKYTKKIQQKPETLFFQA
jgi:hypothetical protein